MRTHFLTALTGAVVVFTAALSIQSFVSAAPAAKPVDVPCGMPPPAGIFVQPPDVDVATLPRNAQGEHELILSAHRHVLCYRYKLDGIAQTVPPTLRVHRGEHFAIRIVNDLNGPSRGENVASTALPPCMPMAMPKLTTSFQGGYMQHARIDGYAAPALWDTNIHLHGFQGPAADENIFLSTLSTPMHACEYHITIPLTQPPGTYFYHPHSHGMSDVQVFGGLSGMWVVEPDAPQIARANEHAVIMRYRLPEVDDYGFMPNYSPIFKAGLVRQQKLRIGPKIAYDPFHPPAQEDTVPLRVGELTLDPTGCSGIFHEPLLSINGANAGVTLNVPANQAQLFRILNATSDSIKFLRLREAGGTQLPMDVVGRDGIPIGTDASPLASYVPMPGVMLPPAGRVDVLVTAQTGNDLILYSDFHCFGAIGGYVIKHDLVTVHAVSAGVAVPLLSQAVTSRETHAAKLLAYARLHPILVGRRAITYATYGHPSDGNPRFYITDTTNANFTEHPFWPQYQPGDMVPRQADVVVKAGAIEEWTLFNTTTEAHSFHIHQMAFVAEDESTGPVMLDTVVVPAGKMLPDKGDPNHHHIQPSATHILLDFRHVPRGTFVFHCHMLFHEDRGMMGIIRVE